MKIRLSLTQDQINVIKHPARFKAIMAGRRWGKTFEAASAMLECACKGDKKSWYSAPSYAQAISVWEMMSTNESILPLVASCKTQPYPIIKFCNGSVIGFRSFDRPKNLRGSGLDLVWVDEIQDITEDHFWPVIRPLISDRRGQMYISGQFRGHNWYYEQMYMRGQDPNQKYYKSWRFPSSSGLVFRSAAGKEELQLVKDSLPSSIYNQEYECIPTANQAGVFRPEDLESAKRGDYLEAGNSGSTYLVAVDIGRVSDPCAVVVLDVDSDCACYSEAFPLGQKHELSAQRVRRISEMFGGASVIADTTGGATGGHADPDEYVKHYRQAVPNMRAFNWTMRNKQEAVTALSLAFEQGKIAIPEENTELRKQLGLYEYKVRTNGNIEYTGGHGHDDLVAALYLGWVAKRRNMFDRKANTHSLAAIGM